MHCVFLARQAMRRTHKLSAVQAIEDGEEAVNHSFIRQALQPLVSMLLDQLTKQEPGQDRDEGIWNLSMAAGTCLGLVAQCVKDEIVSLVMPYVQVGMTPVAAAAKQSHAAAAAAAVLVYSSSVNANALQAICFVYTFCWHVHPAVDCSKKCLTDTWYLIPYLST